MKIGSTLENQKIEKRIAITPEIAKKYISLGFDVQLSKNYGTHLGITDDEYKKIGVKFLSDDKEIIFYGSTYLKIAAFAGPCYPIFFISSALLQGLKKPNYQMIIQQHCLLHHYLTFR